MASELVVPLPRWRRGLTSFRQVLDSDIAHSFRRVPSAVISAWILSAVVVAAILAPLLSVQNPYDLAQLDLDYSELPPIWSKDGALPFVLGTDAQGRDLLSAILYGSRISLVIGLATVVVSLSVGVLLGLMAGYLGGMVDNVLMRIADTLLSLPHILIAVLVSALSRQMLPVSLRDTFASVVLVLSISLTAWVQYARTVRASTLVERGKEYVLAARLIGIPPFRIMLRHILPNTLTPILVTATLNLGLVILIEATLSFLGVGMPPSQPSLGTLIRIGNQYLFSGLWWVVVFPAAYLCLIVLAVNLLGDWLRDALNPKLR
jgi:peptide/nickel transport system permease protein